MKVRELDLFEFVAVSAREMPDHVFTSPDDDWIPVLFLDTPEGNVTVPLHEYMGDDIRKDMLAEVLIPSIIDETKASVAVMIVSTWASETSSKVLNETGEYLRPSEQADRKEQVFIVEYKAEGVTRTTSAEILRFVDKVPQLGEWKDYDAVVDVGGRFAPPIVNALKAVNA